MAKAEIKAVLSLDNNPFIRGLRKSEQVAEAAGNNIKNVFASMAAPLATIAPAIAAAFTGGAIVAGVSNVFSMAKGMDDLSDQTGISVGRLAMLGKAFRAAGLEAEDVGTVVNRMQRFLVEASETGKGGDLLGRLGVSALQLRQLAPEEQMQRLGNAIAGIADPAERAAAAQEVFSKSGGRLLAVFKDPAFAKAGGPLSENAAILEQNAGIFAEASIKLSQAGAVFRGFYLGVAEAVAGPLVTVLDQIGKANLVQMGEGFGSAIITGATAFVRLLTAVKQSDFFPSAKAVGAWLSWGGQKLSEAAHDAAEYWRGSVEEAQQLGRLATAAGSFLVGAAGALGPLFGGAVDVFRGKLMQAPLGMINLIVGGFNYAVDSLWAGMQRVNNTIQGAFSYIAEHFTADLGTRLLGAAATFGKAIFNPLEAGRMLFDALNRGAGATLQQHVDRAAGENAAASGEVSRRTLADYLMDAGISLNEGAQAWAKQGEALETRGNANIAKAGAMFNAELGKVGGQFVAALRSPGATHGGGAAGAAGTTFAAAAAGGATAAVARGMANTFARGIAFGPSALGGMEGLGSSGGLSGAGSDTAEAARQRLAQIRRDVKFKDPHLAGAALEEAVRAADKKQRDDAFTDKYRREHGAMGPDPAKEKPEVNFSSSAITQLRNEFAGAIKELLAT